MVDEFGRQGPIRKKEPGLDRLLFMNRVAAVEVGLEWREQHIYVELIRLVDGQVQPNPIAITQGSKLTTFNLDDLVTIGTGDAKPPVICTAGP